METTDVYKKLGKRIAEVRKNIPQYSQEDLAGDAGLNRAYIGYIERGERKPTIETVEKIARALDVELYELFEF